ncbi:MAG: glycosyltransferase family 2 protein [Gemmiger sp.]
MKLITFTVPCYNSAAYMRHCIETLLPAGEDAEIILVDDGSKDDTGRIADEYAEKYPSIVRAIHQENGGHGEGVNQGIRNASGLYFKVVDSDDWLDAGALQKVMTKLREFAAMPEPVDLLLCNYVYEHVTDNTSHTIGYRHILPEDRIFGWNEIGRFPPSQNILMHSVIYRTQVLRDCGLELPKHTFYVDNIFVYQPLPACKTLYYMNLDLYRYFIGREDQSVNEKVMVGRVDQQVRVTKIMIHAVDLYALPPEQEKLQAYMFSYLSMMMTISTVFLTMADNDEARAKKAELWEYLKNYDERVYKKVRHSVAGAVNLPGRLGEKLALWGYHAAQKIFKFN